MPPVATVLLALFSHPAMLGWLAVATAPLIIHLLNRRKFREMQWAAMQYLLAAVRKNARRILIEQWLLLALRTLIIVLVVTAVAEPLLEATGLKLSGGQRTHKVLVVDASYSMAYKPTDKSRFDRAKELAARIVDAGNQGDGFTLVLLADPPRVVVSSPAFQPADFHEEISNLKLIHGGADLPATLARVEELLGRVRREHPRLTREEVYLLSDLGRTTWMPELGGAGAVTEFRQRSQRLGRQTQLVVIDLGQEDSENTAVTSLAHSESFLSVGRDVTFEAEVQNFGRQARSRQLLEWFVDGRRVGEQFVDLEPRGRATSAFTYRFDSDGDHHVEARLAADLLELDNRRYLAAPVKEQLRVLCVNGKPGGDFKGATDYLAVALSPQDQGGTVGLVRTNVVPESALQELDLGAYDAAFLANVGQFTASEARILESYLAGGGGLVFFLGDQVQADSYNRHLDGEPPAGPRVLPARLGQRVTEARYRLDPLDYRHPLLAAFRGQEQAGLITTPVYEYFRLDVSGHPESRVALAFDNGDPLIVEAALHRGRSIVVATSADVSWTTWPMWTSYVPIVQELLALAVRGQGDERNVRVGQTLGRAVRALATQTELTVRSPSGEQHSIRLTADGDWCRWTYADTSASGIYTASFGPPLSMEESYAVNVDTAESDLSKLSASELGQEVWPGVRFETWTEWQDPSQSADQPIARQSTLHQWLLGGALGLLLLESLLACYFARRAI